MKPLLFCVVIAAGGVLRGASPTGQLSAAPAGWTMSQQGVFQVLRPASPPDARVAVVVGPEEAPTGGFEDWLRQKSGGLRDPIAERGTLQTINASAASITNVYQGTAGRYIVLFCGLRKRDGNWQVLTVRCPAERAVIENSMRQIKPVLAALLTTGNNGAAEAGGHTQPSQNQAGGSAPNRGNNQEQAHDRMLAAIRTPQPGAGVKDAEIAVVLHEGRGGYVGTTYQYIESVDLLLKDGSAYTGLEIPPEDLDASASRRLEPGKWHRWKQQAGSYYFESANGQWQKVDGSPVQMAQSGSSLDRNVIYRKAFGMIGMGGSVFTREFHFFPTGRYERSKSALHGSGTVQAASGFSASASSYEDKNGRRGSSAATLSNANGTVGVTSLAQGRGRGTSDFAGTYQVQGYALELHSDSGTIERLLIFYPRLKPGDTNIFLGDASFYNDR